MFDAINLGDRLPQRLRQFFQTGCLRRIALQIKQRIADASQINTVNMTSIF